MTSLGSFSVAYAVDEEDVRTELRVSFEAVAEAERSGGDISELVGELNMIAVELESASEEEYSELLRRVLEVAGKANAVDSVGEPAEMNQVYVSTAILLSTGLLVLLVWALFPVLYWKLWLRSKGDWIIS
jgi:hypothetical protein